jgi:hypothetical protein
MSGLGLCPISAPRGPPPAALLFRSCACEVQVVNPVLIREVVQSIGEEVRGSCFFSKRGADDDDDSI